MFEGPQMGLKDVITGNVIVEAPSLEAATEMAKACPVFDIEGSVEVWPLPSEAVAAPMARANAAE